MGNYYQPEIETMPVEQILALQSERLIKQVRYVYDHVKFYHDKMDEIGVMPDDIHGVEDLHKLLLQKMICGINILMGCWQFL